MMFESLISYVPFLALFLRVVVGVNLVMHGYPKVKDPQATLKWTGNLGVPAAATVLAMVLEFLGGIALILGVLVPVVAFFVVLEMIGNIALKKTKMKGTYLIGQSAAAYEPDVLYILLSVTLIVLGAGAFALGALIGL